MTRSDVVLMERVGQIAPIESTAFVLDIVSHEPGGGINHAAGMHHPIFPRRFPRSFPSKVVEDGAAQRIALLLEGDSQVPVFDGVGEKLHQAERNGRTPRIP